MSLMSILNNLNMKNGKKNVTKKKVSSGDMARTKSNQGQGVKPNMKKKPGSCSDNGRFKQ